MLEKLCMSCLAGGDWEQHEKQLFASTEGAHFTVLFRELQKGASTESWCSYSVFYWRLMLQLHLLLAVRV